MSPLTVGRRRGAVLLLLQVMACDAVFGTGGDDAPRDAVADTGADAPCGDVQADPDNCGRCGRSCGGGECTAGVCQPVELASNQSTPDRLWLTDTMVYWVDSGDGAVRRVPKAGGLVEALITMEPSGPRDVAVDATHVYWTARTNAVIRCLHAGCMGMPQIVTTCAAPGAIVVSEADVHVACTGMNEIRRVGKAGAPVVTVGPTAVGVTDMVRVGDAVYWGVMGGSPRIEAAPLLGVGATFISDVKAQAMTGNTDTLFWAATDVAGVFRAAGGGASGTLVSDQLGVVGLAADDATVYFVGGGLMGYLRSCPAIGCAGATDVLIGLPSPTSVAVDADFVYLATAPGAGAGTILRVAR